MTDALIGPVFPLFYSYYGDNAFGSIRITNGGDEMASDISMSFCIQQYMDNPKQIELDHGLAPGESAELDISALFTEEVPLITEGTSASAEMTIDYTVGEQAAQEVSTQTVRFLNRSAMSWSDDRRAAAFTTARDPLVLASSKNAAGIARSREVCSINVARQTLQYRAGDCDDLSILYSALLESNDRKRYGRS